MEYCRKGNGGLKVDRNLTISTTLVRSRSDYCVWPVHAGQLC